MNGTTTLIVEASGSSTGVILGGVSLAVVLSSLLGLALYVLRKRGVVTAEQVEQAKNVAEDALKSPVVAAAVASTGNETLAQVVETAKQVVKDTPIVEKSIAASETSISLHV
jgi:orotate phosphoribosyltransferase-like protein